MGKYLSALQRQEIGDPPIEALQQLQEPPSRTFCSGQVEASEKNGDVTARCWRVAYPKAAPMEVLFAPPATHAEVAAIYQGATVDVLRQARRNATASETAELRRLIAEVLADDTERADTLAFAVVDPDAALRSFRALATQR